MSHLLLSGIWHQVYRHMAQQASRCSRARRAPTAPASCISLSRIKKLQSSSYVLDYLASGMSQEEILRDFPDLTPEDIQACLAFAADRERRLVSIPPE